MDVRVTQRQHDVLNRIRSRVIAVTPAHSNTERTQDLLVGYRCGLHNSTADFTLTRNGDIHDWEIAK